VTSYRYQAVTNPSRPTKDDSWGRLARVSWLDRPFVVGVPSLRVWLAPVIPLSLLIVQRISTGTDPRVEEYRDRAAPEWEGKPLT
jgi:hypothetical protein